MKWKRVTKGRRGGTRANMDVRVKEGGIRVKEEGLGSERNSRG